MPPPTFSGELMMRSASNHSSREHRADDVDDRVERANFVQVNLLDRNLMDGGFGLAETMEQRLGARLRGRRQRRPLDQSVDLREAAMGVVMRDGGRRVRMFVLVHRARVRDRGHE